MGQWIKALTTLSTASDLVPSKFRGDVRQLDIVQLLEGLAKIRIFQGDWLPTFESLGATSFDLHARNLHGGELNHDTSLGFKSTTLRTIGSRPSSYWVDHGPRIAAPADLTFGVKYLFQKNIFHDRTTFHKTNEPALLVS